MNQKLIIACYGDSNTRYYLGDDQKDGPDADSYPSKLQALFHQAGRDSVSVLNRGYPDMQSAFGMAHFRENVLQPGADVCILGFGTNDIRQENADMASYLRHMESMMKQCAERRIEALCLLIPWYSREYAGEEAQKRIGEWNRQLLALCLRYDVQVIDTYTLFVRDPDRYFNEKATPQRHYSSAATQEIAQLVFDILEQDIG